MLNDLLKKAFLQPVEQEIIVKAEELPQEGGVDFSKTFFEPQVGMDYTIKFIQNIGGENLVHRKVYKNLPDPTRRGKTFQFISSGVASTCKALELFFDLNNLKKNGDVLAIQKIEEFLGATNQAACVVQILESPVKEDIGNFRLMSFSNFGPNATVANLINEKLNPTPAQIKAGYEKENIFDLFDSPVLLLSCTEATYEGRKGRDFTKTSWSKKNRGAFVITDEATGKIHTFSKNDVVNGEFASPEAEAAFVKVLDILQAPQLSMHNYFEYKVKGDPKNSEETEKYLETLYKKVDEIIPVIKNAKNIHDIKNYGKIDNSDQPTPGHNDGAQIIGNKSAADILKDSAPSELSGLVGNSQTEQPTQSSTPSTSEENVDDILNS